MRIVLVGSPERREQLRANLPDGIDVIAEATTMSAARALALDAEAFLIATRESSEFAPLPEALTPREIQVLALVADGLSNKAVARRLGVSDETVKFHLASIFGKLGASNRTDAVRQALRRGLLAL